MFVSYLVKGILARVSNLQVLGLRQHDYKIKEIQKQGIAVVDGKLQNVEESKTDVSLNESIIFQKQNSVEEQLYQQKVQKQEQMAKKIYDKL